MSAKEDTQKRMLSAVRKSHEVYKKTSSRSNKKLKVLHGWIIDELTKILDSSYQIEGLNIKSSKNKSQSKELKIDGMYYPKKVDVAVKKDDRVLGVVSVKFVMSNYQQNSRNYFEQQLGETANLRRSDIVFGHIMFLTNPIPYYKKGGALKDTHNFNDDDVERYFKLVQDHEHAHTPDVQAICIFQLEGLANGSKGGIVRICKRKDLSHLSKENWEN